MTRPLVRGIPGISAPSLTLTLDRDSFERLRRELALPPCREIKTVVRLLPAPAEPELDDPDAWYAAEVERMAERAPA